MNSTNTNCMNSFFDSLPITIQYNNQLILMKMTWKAHLIITANIMGTFTFLPQNIRSDNFHAALFKLERIIQKNCPACKKGN